MIFPSLKKLPAPILGKMVVTWEYRPAANKKIWLIGMAIGVAALVAYVWLAFGFDNDLFRRYKAIVFYLAPLALPFLLPLFLAQLSKREYVLYETGFQILIGNPKRMLPGSGWAYWRDFDRAELAADGVQIFPRAGGKQRVYFFCKENRLMVYSFSASKIAEHRFSFLKNRA